MVKRILGPLFIVSMTFLTSVGCGPNEVAVPEQTATDEQDMAEYYKKVEEAEKKGIDPSTIPAP